MDNLKLSPIELTLVPLALLALLAEGFTKLFSGRKKGQSVPALSGVIIALIIPLIILIMYVVQVKFSNAIDRGDWTAAQNGTFTDVTSNADDSYDMAGILPIAIIGIVVLSMIVGAIGGFAYIRSR